jgi:hypothetical protein
MHTPATGTSKTMSELVIANPKIALTPLGLDVSEPLSHEEWREIGRRIGRAMRSAAFVIGDWLVYGEGRAAQGTFWSDIPAQDSIAKRVYDEASELTGMDWVTLQNYAYVSRNVPRSLRNENLSWEHHKKVAKLKNDFEKTRWLKLAAEKKIEGKPVSTRRLARSIEAGRLLSPDEMRADDSDRGIENVHPYVNSICAFWGKLERSGWLESATPEKREALSRDLRPVVDIYERLLTSNQPQNS